jgi:hypothetical protein
VPEALEAIRRSKNRLGSDPSHAGASGFLLGLESRPELNGIRVKLEEWVEDKRRWRVRRADTGEAIGAKLDHLAPETPGQLPYLIAVGVAGTEQHYALAWLNSGGKIDAPSRSLPGDTGATLLMMACNFGKADLAAELLRRGANIDARDDNGTTALMCALPYPQIVSQLLAAGAQTHCKWTDPVVHEGDTAAAAEAAGGGASSVAGGADADGASSSSTVGQQQSTRRLVPGTALEIAETVGHKAAAELLRKHATKDGGAGGVGGTGSLRDVFALEQDTVMRVLAALLIGHRAGLGDDTASLRTEWLQRLVREAFADPVDAANLSKRFAEHGDKRLDVDIWCAAAQADAEVLTTHPRFESAVDTVSEELPGLREAIHAQSGIV